MGYLVCPVCERESLSNVHDLQVRVATALTRLLPCPICSATVNGLQAFHHHLAAHLPSHSNSSTGPLSNTTTPCDLPTPSYPPTSSPEAIPTLEHLDINDGTASPCSPANTPHTSQDIPDVNVGTSIQELSPASISDSASFTDSAPVPAHNCDVCGLIFSTEHFLKIHKDIIHSKSNYFDVTCKLCKKKFKDLESYRNHVREEHTDRRYMCDQCPKTFTKRGSLVVHNRMFHDPSSPGACHTCNKSFTTRARRELHERRFHGRTSPSGRSSPTRQDNNNSTQSTLRDAKNWLEILMSKNKTSSEECESVVKSQPTPPHCPSTNDYLPQESNTIQDCTEKILIKECQQIQQQTEESHMVIKKQLKEQREERDWSSEMQPFSCSEDRHNTVQQHKPSTDMCFPSFKSNIVFPCQMMQQNLGPSRSHSDFPELKDEKKIGMDTVSSRIVSGHMQSSPIAVVSPQPHKSETPPTVNVSQDASQVPAEANRSSFSLINPNKVGLPQADTIQVHPSVRTSDISCETSVPGLGLGGVGEKLEPGARLIYPQCYNVVPNLSQNVALLNSDSKLGMKVSPLLLPGSHYAADRLKECTESLTQPMDIQKDLSTCEVRPMVTGLGVTQHSGQEQLSPEVPQPSPTVSLSSSLTPSVATPTPHPRKQDGGVKPDNKQWECEVCKKSFTTKYFLKKHKRLHTGETPYACGECGKTFTFQQSYHKHVLYHSDDKPHQCSYCGRAFKEMSTLHNHVRIHTGEKPFVCETCGKAFRQRVSYLVHQRIHTGVMPYTCNICHRSFRYKVSLRSHKCEPSLASSSHSSSSLKEPPQEPTPQPQQSVHHPIPPPPPPRHPVLTSTMLHPSPPTTTTVDMKPGVCSPGVVDSGPGHAVPTNIQQDPAAGRLRPPPLETIDVAAISCDSLAAQEAKQFHMLGSQDIKQFHTLESQDVKQFHTLATQDAKQLNSLGAQDSKQFQKRQMSGSQTTRGIVGTQGGQDPLSMAFLHALVDPNQARLHSECRPPPLHHYHHHHHHHPQLPPETLPFPSLSPGTMDPDMDHDTFFTNLLM